MIILPHGIYSKFQSTRPVRGATPYYIRKDTDPKVSIHAPRAGRDYARQSRTPSFRRFNPRAPCGARLSAALMLDFILVFQSTRPVRGATFPLHSLRTRFQFQSTRPVRGATVLIGAHTKTLRFNPRAPCGARLMRARPLA